MPATVPTRGVLKASTNRVRTSTALQGNSMWENVIGITNDQAGTNTGVEALINAPTVGGGRKASQARRQAAAEAVMATGGFDTSITNYASLLAIAKQQGAVGGGSRGACKICGQLGHLTKQCRNGLASGGGEAAQAGLLEAGAELVEPQVVMDDDSLDLSDSSDEERRRKKRRKEKERKSKHSKSSKDRKHKSFKAKKEKKEKKDKKEKSSKHKKKKRRHSSSSGSSSSGSGSD